MAKALKPEGEKKTRAPRTVKPADPVSNFYISDSDNYGLRKNHLYFQDQPKEKGSTLIPLTNGVSLFIAPPVAVTKVTAANVKELLDLWNNNQVKDVDFEEEETK